MNVLIEDKAISLTNGNFELKMLIYIASLLDDFLINKVDKKKFKYFNGFHIICKSIIDLICMHKNIRIAELDQNKNCEVDVAKWILDIENSYSIDSVILAKNQLLNVTKNKNLRLIDFIVFTDEGDSIDIRDLISKKLQGNQKNNKISEIRKIEDMRSLLDIIRQEDPKFKGKEINEIDKISQYFRMKFYNDMLNSFYSSINLFWKLINIVTIPYNYLDLDK